MPSKLVKRFLEHFYGFANHHGNIDYDVETSESDETESRLVLKSNLSQHVIRVEE